MRLDNTVQALLQYVPFKSDYTLTFQDSTTLHVITIPDSSTTSDNVILENYNNLFYRNNTFLQSIQLNNYIGLTSPFTGNMLVFAPANGTSYTIQATNPASSLVYSIGDMGVNSDFVFTNSSQTLNNKTLDYAYKWLTNN